MLLAIYLLIGALLLFKANRRKLAKEAAKEPENPWLLGIAIFLVWIFWILFFIIEFIDDIFIKKWE